MVRLCDSNKLDRVLGEHIPPWTRQIITPMLISVSINQVCNSLTIYFNGCRAMVVLR